MINVLLGIWIGGAIVSFASSASEYGEMPDNSYLTEVGITSVLWPIYVPLTIRENWKYRNGRSEKENTTENSR